MPENNPQANNPQVALVVQEIKQQLASKEIVAVLMATTFKGLDETTARQALMDGMIRGFSFQNFLQKDIYAIKYGNTYSLITSIGHARKVGMRSGIVGVSKPEYTYDDDGKIVDCTVTVDRKIDDYIGHYTATVDFNEYTTKQNLWVSKPKTMIAKVAEMHALRKACPEEMSENYIEEEFDKEVIHAGKFSDTKKMVDASNLKMGTFENHEEKTIDLDTGEAVNPAPDSSPE